MLNGILRAPLGVIWKAPLTLYILSVEAAQKSMMEPPWLQLLWRPKRRIFLGSDGLHGDTLLQKEIYIHVNRYGHITPKAKLDSSWAPGQYYLLYTVHIISDALVRAFIATRRAWSCGLSHRECPALSEAVCLPQSWSQSLFLLISLSVFLNIYSCIYYPILKCLGYRFPF